MFISICIFLIFLIQDSGWFQIHEYVNKIKSYKFVPLIYQLVARLKQQDDKSDTFPLILLNLLGKNFDLFLEADATVDVEKPIHACTHKL